MKKFINKTKLIGYFDFDFYQQLDRIQFTFLVDWSEKPFMFAFSFLFWTLEIGIYTNKKDIY